MNASQVMEDTDLSSMLRIWARARPDQPALIEPVGGRPRSSSWRAITFGELDALVDRYAHGLAQADVRRGDRVLFLIPPSAESLAVLYALSRLRAIPVAIDPGMGLAAMLQCIESIRPRVVLAVPAIHSLRLLVRRPFEAGKVFLTNGRHRLWNDGSLAQCRSGRAAPFDGGPAAATEPCFIVFTSGSTGPAKPVTITNGMIEQRIRLVKEICGWQPGSKVVVCFPSQAPTALANGLTAILPRMDFARPANASPTSIVDSIIEHGAEAVLASPVVWMNLVRYCEQRHVKLPTLRHAVTAGAPIPIDLHHRLLEVIHPEGTLHTPYGSTEALPVTSVDSRKLGETWSQTRHGQGICVGQPVRGVRVEVIRITDDRIPAWSDDLRVRQGEIGELVVCGPVVSPEYTELPDANAEAKISCGHDTFHRMGDLGWIDDRGRVWFCGRKSDRIETRGRVLLPVLGESIFNEHRLVFRSAIVGVGGAEHRTVVACIELEPGNTMTHALVNELEEMTRDTGWSGVIERFIQHPAFPVDARHNSKIRRSQLESWALQRLRRGLKPGARR